MSARLVEIRFGFRTAVARPCYPVHLDAVLLYANAALAGGEADALEQLDRAMEIHGSGDDRVYCCSAIHFDVVEHFTRFNTRRIDMDTYARDIESGLVKTRASSMVYTVNGDVKGMLADIPMMWVSEAHAYALVKDLLVFDQLISQVRQIGKYGRTGCGLVSWIEVDPETSESQERWMERVLPFATDGAAPVRATVSPPYWDRHRIRNAYMHPTLVG